MGGGAGGGWTAAARIARLLALLALSMLASCSSAPDVGLARDCRLFIPILNPTDAQIDVARTEAWGADGRGISIRYTVRTQGAAPRQRLIACRFDDSGEGERRQPIAIATEAGPVGDIRMYFLRRYWLTARTLTSDPAPLADVEDLLQLPAPVAATLQQVLSGLPAIAIYALLAASYALIYGLIGRINLAFGELAMLGGYGAVLGFSLTAAGASTTGAVALGVAIAALAGLATAAVYSAAAALWVFRPLMGASLNHLLVATLGLALAMEEFVRLAQGNGMHWLPPFFNQPMALARAGTFIVTVTAIGIAVIVAAAAAVLATLYVMKASRFGRAWRAFADDPLAAAMFGVSPAGILTATFLLAGVLSGLGGVVMALFYGGVGYSGGLALGLKALFAAIIGGIGSVPGAIFGGLVLGALEAAWSLAFRIEYRDAFLFCLLAIVIVLRPNGLFGWGQVPEKRV